MHTDNLQTFSTASINESPHDGPQQDDTTYHRSRHYSTGSRDSMVLLQIVDNTGHILIEDGNDDDYDHLNPKGDFSPLCSCTYGPMGDYEEREVAQGQRKEGHHNTASFEL